MKTIEIAPAASTVHVERAKIWVDWHGQRITYSLPARKHFTEDIYPACRQALSTAIALSSKWWQAEESLNRYFNVSGRLSTEALPASDK